MPPNSFTVCSTAATTASEFGGVGLDGQRPHAERLGRVRGLPGLVRLADIGECYIGAFARQTLDDGSADPTAPASDQCPFALERIVVHVVPRNVRRVMTPVACGGLLTHRKHHPESSLAAHHTVISLRDTLEGIGLVHWPNSSPHAERERILRVD